MRIWIYTAAWREGGDKLPEYEYTFTVFTPTFNRAHTLHRGYQSLCAQTFRDFEWLVVDDGSTDSTPELIQEWQQKANYPIQYIRQENLGKHTAINRAAQAARGELFLFLDSDDAYVPNAFERYKYHWDTIPGEQKHRFSAVSSLTIDPQGRVIGSRFPYDPTDSDSLEIRYKYKVTGEKRGFHRTDVVREFPLPRFENEKIAIDSLLWNRIALKYKTRYVNEALMIYYPTPNNMGARRFISRARNPRGARQYYWELIGCGYPFSPAALIKEYANYVRFSIHAGVPIRDILQDAPSQVYCLAAFPLGWAVYRRDLFDLKATEAQQKKSEA